MHVPLPLLTEPSGILCVRRGHRQLRTRSWLGATPLPLDVSQRYCAVPAKEVSLPPRHLGSVHARLDYLAQLMLASLSVRCAFETPVGALRDISMTAVEIIRS